jgi:hypothetical protein
MTRNYVFIRNLHWISIGLQIKAHYEAKGESVLLTGIAPLLAKLTKLGLAWEKDLASLAQCHHDLAESPSGSCCLVLHHHKSVATDLGRMKFLIAPDNPFLVSFYADGFNNQLLHPEAVAAFLAQHSYMIPRDLIFFDVQEPRLPSHAERFQIEVVDSQNLRLMTQLAPLAQRSRDAIEAVAQRASNTDLLILVLRPWGSSLFHGGRLAVEDPARKLAAGMYALIQAVVADLGYEPAIAIRPDDRDRELMAAFEMEFARLSNVKTFSLNDYWPADLTLEPFIDNFAKHASSMRLHLATLDSTAPLPFIRMGKGDRHYLGAPEAVITSLLDRGEVEDAVRTKIRRLSRHVHALAGRFSIEVKVIEPFFFRAGPSTQ